MIQELTKQYIEAFNSRDLNRVAELLSDDFVLEDPVVNRIEGKSASLKAIQDIFDSANELSFSAKNIFISGEHGIIEFSLILDNTKLEGVDILEWNNGSIKELRAYLDISKGE